jgi:hypothetical protein
MTNVIHPVDVERLRTEVQAKYREVAADYHFHTGRVHARRLGYPPSPLDQLPEVRRGRQPLPLDHPQPGERVRRR